ncbi:MAG: hypothetical protein ABIE94_01950, partial [archaeon]
MKKSIRILLALFIFLALAGSAFGATQVISNSADWRDVYSAMLYGSLTDATSNFLVSTRHGTLLLNYIPKNPDLVEIISSNRDPYVVGYKNIVVSAGFDTVEEYVYANVNLDLLDENLPDITNFVVIDDSYGYNAVSVAPYAVVSNSWVLFADRRNMGAVNRVLSGRTVDQVIIYGQVDREVKDSLAQYDPIIINTGDRFENNHEIVDRYLAINPTKQATLTNGEFIEQSIMSGVEPVLFIGRVNVPDSVREYVADSSLEVGILIGNELVGAATFIRRQIGISVFVKFAQSARSPSGTISQVEDLDRFFLPRYTLDLDIDSIVYNEATGALEVTYKSNVDVAIYFKSTVTLNDDETPPQKRVGDPDPIFIDGQAFKTVFYDKTVDGRDLLLIGDNLSGSVSTIFGEAPNSLELLVEKDFIINRIDVMDESELEIAKVQYDRGGNRFLVTLENVGPVDVFSKVELIDLWINGEFLTVASEDIVFLEVGESLVVSVPVEMVEEDEEFNQIISVKAYYGEREQS